MLVAVDDDLALARRDLDRNDLVLEAPRLLRRLGLVLRGDGELILLLAGDLPALRHVLCGIAHVVAVEGVPQAIPDHGIDHLRVAHLDAVAQMDAVRRLTHALLPAGDDDRRIAVADRLVAERHCPQPRPAELVDAIGGHLDGNAGADRGLPCRVLTLARRQDLAHDDLGDVRGGDPGPLDRFDDRDLAEIVRRHAAQAAIEGAHRRPRGGGNHDFGHWTILSISATNS